MRFIIFTTLCLALFLVEISAQKNTQPPKVTSVTKSTDYVSEEGGFKASFPSKPTRSVSSIDSAFGKADYVNFVLPTALAYYSVGFIDFPTVIKDEKELRTRYDSVKNKLVSTGTIRLTDETEIYFGEHLGREFVYEKDNATYTIRCFIIEQRFFQISVGTRGSLVNSSEKVKSYSKKIIDNFLNSFAVTKLPTPKSLAVELPESFGVMVENSVFRSEFFKVTCELPKDWRITEQEENDVIKDLIQESAKKELPKSGNAVDLSLQNSRFLLMTTKAATDESKKGAVLGIVAEKVSFPNFVPGVMTDSFPKLFLTGSEKVVKTTTLEKFGGVEFAWIEIFDADANYYKRLYIANRKGIAFEFFFTYQDPKDLEIMLKSLQSLKFEE